MSELSAGGCVFVRNNSDPLPSADLPDYECAGFISDHNSHALTHALTHSLTYLLPCLRVSSSFFT